MKIDIEKYKETLKKVIKGVTIYTIIILSCVASFFIGYYYKKLNSEKTVINVEVKKIKKSQISLAIDENNNLLIIDIKTGNYTVYQDSVGKMIFKLYAKTVWVENSTNNETVK